MSASESIDVARAVKEQFDREADVDIWNEDIFNPNTDILETLFYRASCYDFVIAIFSADDEARIRARTVAVTRGNVIFEFGLFMGRMGLNRAFFVLEEGTELFSDWYGRATVTFRRRANLEAAVGSACNKLRREMAMSAKLEDFLPRPSTISAINYFNHLLLPLIDSISDSSLSITESSSAESTDGALRPSRITFCLLLPRTLQDLHPSRLSLLTAEYGRLMLTMKSRPRRFALYIKSQETTSESVTLYDVPTVMYSAKPVIDRMFPQEFLERHAMRQQIERQEISNFEKVLGSLASKAGYDDMISKPLS
jgi:hypothetical protein